ncbi:MAG TPA: DUF1553 domain-containing protein [Chthoniobacteraceae bacterium]|nr:DUF1553 domain-containing protein [Chthoniobacteraceae bacterium]
MYPRGLSASRGWTTPALLAIFCSAGLHFAIGGQPVRFPFENTPEAAANAEGSPSHSSTSKIDEFVFGRLKKMGIQPANPCSDEVFVRRVYLDVTGSIPTADEAAAFIADNDPRKRAQLIDRLLDSDGFTDYLGLKWCDVLRVKSEFPVNLWPEAAQAYDHWVRAALRRNTPYSLFATELLTASGSNFRVPPVNFYRSAGGRDRMTLARAVALAFMGERIEAWPKEKQEAMAVFFSQVGFKSTNEWKEEIVFYNGITDSADAPKQATLPDGAVVALPPGKDPRAIFANWLVTSKNSPFARNGVNRTWYWLFGRGIINDPDDCRPDNPPSNPELLEWLAQELAASNYDIKHIYRLILNSNTYQLSCIPASSDPRAAANFAYYPLHRVEAEALIDAIDQITGSNEEYSSMTPEPYTFIPPDKRTIDLPDGSIGSAFLDLFGRPPRDTGLVSERNGHVTAGQRLHLLNSSAIQAKLARSTKLRDLMRTAPTPADAVARLYLTILSRTPTPDELKAIKTYSLTSEAKGQAVLLDVAWALINSSEFLYHH